MRVGAGGLLEQPVEQQPSSSGGPPVEPEGELVEVVGQVLPADPVVQGAGCPSFEQRGNQVRSGHDRVEITGQIARAGLMSEAVVGESGEHQSAIGVDLGAGCDDLAGELHLIQPLAISARCSRTRPKRPLGSRSTAIVIGALSEAPPGLPWLRPPRKLWSSSTTPLSSSRSGRTMARRSLCSHAHAVSYEANPRASCKPRADTPFFCEVTNQIAANQVDNGVCER